MALIAAFFLGLASLFVTRFIDAFISALASLFAAWLLGKAREALAA